MSLHQPLMEGSEDYRRGDRLRRKMMMNAQKGEFCRVVHHLQEHPDDAVSTLAATGDTLLHLVAHHVQVSTQGVQDEEDVMCCVGVILAVQPLMVMAPNNQMNTPLFMLLKGFYNRYRNREISLQVIRLFLNKCPLALSRNFTCRQQYLSRRGRTNRWRAADYEEVHCMNHFMAACMNHHIPNELIREMLEINPLLSTTYWGSVTIHQRNRLGMSDLEVYQKASDTMRLDKNPMEAIFHGSCYRFHRGNEFFKGTLCIPMGLDDPQLTSLIVLSHLYARCFASDNKRFKYCRQVYNRFLMIAMTAHHGKPPSPWPAGSDPPLHIHYMCRYRYPGFLWHKKGDWPRVLTEKDENGTTPLHIALSKTFYGETSRSKAEKYSWMLATTLLRADSKLADVRDNGYMTPLDRALVTGPIDPGIVNVFTRECPSAITGNCSTGIPMFFRVVLTYQSQPYVGGQLPAIGIDRCDEEMRKEEEASTVEMYYNMLKANPAVLNTFPKDDRIQD